MRLIKNRTTKLFLAAASVLLVAWAGVYIYLAKISADVNINDTDFLADIQDQPNLNDPTLIRLPESYSKDTIQKALNNQVTATKGLTGSDKEITDYIKTQEDKIARTLPLQKGTKDQPAMNDLVFQVADSKGNKITPSATGTKAVITSVTDNFDFDVSVTQQEKDLMLQAYPIIESIYGPRQNTDKIKVFHFNDLGRGSYSSGNNQISLDRDNRTDEPIHELAHAFHGYRCLGSLWEEGSAVFVTNYVAQKIGMPSASEAYITQNGYNLNFENLPSTVDSDINNAWNPWIMNLPYEYGSMILEKISLEDIGFFKKFNQQLYAASGQFYSQSAILKMAITCVSKIEGEDSWIWFSHQYPYIEYYQHYMSGKEFYFSELADSVNTGYWSNEPEKTVTKGGVGGASSTFSFTIRASYNIDSSDFNVRLLGEKGQLLLDSPGFDTTDKFGMNEVKTYNNPPDNYKKYQGLVYVEITPTTNPNNKQTFSFLKTDEPIGGKNVFVTSKAGTIAVFSGANGSNKTAVAKTNGYFSLRTDWLGAAGRDKVEIYDKKSGCNLSNLLDCLGTKVDEKYFNKGISPNYYPLYLNLGGKNNCGARVPEITSLNRSLSFKLTTSTNCGAVVSLNRIPMYRSWGTSSTLTLPDLARNRSYRYQVSYASDISKPLMKLGTALTGSYADFRLLSSQSFGDPLKNTFYQRLTFSSPYDPKSLNLELSGIGPDDYRTTFTTRKVSDTVVDIIPSHTYNNLQYSMVNLNNVTDTHGNPIYKFDWNMAGFQTPLNPPGAAVPSYSLSADSYHSADSVIINKNFSSKDLETKLSGIRLIREVDRGECDSPSDDVLPPCSVVEFTASIVGNQIIIKPTQPMIAGKSYWLTMPEVTDDSNNVVNFGMWDTLSFSVN